MCEVVRNQKGIFFLESSELPNDQTSHFLMRYCGVILGSIVQNCRHAKVHYISCQHLDHPGPTVAWLHCIPVTDLLRLSSTPWSVGSWYLKLTEAACRRIPALPWWPAKWHTWPWKCQQIAIFQNFWVPNSRPTGKNGSQSHAACRKRSAAITMFLDGCAVRGAVHVGVVRPRAKRPKHEEKTAGQETTHMDGWFMQSIY